MRLEQLRELCLNEERFPQKILEWIEIQNLWNLWVPQKYGGLGASFTEGLEQLQRLARIDGSLGWTVTLCSGANFFIGNLMPQVTAEIFGDRKKSVCFGGSGGAFGTAVKEGDSYLLSGCWRYATGVPYLTHFTLNATIMENGREQKNEDGSPLIRSFLLPAEKVHVLEDWHTMGLKATATHSFDVREVRVHEKYSFVYDKVYLADPLFKIPFPIFADLTLWVNYIGMAEHFLEKASEQLPIERLADIKSTLDKANKEIMDRAQKIENRISRSLSIADQEAHNIHLAAVISVQALTKAIITCYPFLGIRACSDDQIINQVFRDYFTATQHHIFTKMGV